MLYSNSLPKARTLSSSLVKAQLLTRITSNELDGKAARFDSPSTPRLTLVDPSPQRVPALDAQPLPARPAQQRSDDLFESFKSRGFSVLRESESAIGLIKHVRSKGRIAYTIDLTISLDSSATTIAAEGAYCLALEDDMQFICRSFPLEAPAREIEAYFAREYDPQKHAPLD
ncbi:hypothetical protein DEE91_14800 [Ralstonia pickettii]|jgi:hypothetical protein|uniref:Uncharacterized protein n=1 Tax=Ralstonia insidiosa TaxID=190721 RepID=A0A192A7W6_9RALS|nr:hypothetical protein A9Y76_27870 [Ralstonia insidiosa]KMW47681.1 hypothetical protein AC240_08965 [Ralstonia sp. MD27]MBA9885015.1 hypothetical protein [Ralstonia pickettii]MBA9869732.1 hypothetical protein [Ralstonia insidiosa]MBA9894763.1 hypothetical protein [Ralstonia pickettii]